MNGEEDKTIDISTESPEAGAEGEPKQVGDALSGINRLLSEDEMKDNPGALKLVLDRVDKLETEVKNLSGYREKYHEEKTRADVLNEKLKSLEDIINVKSALTLLGGVALGALTSFWNNWAVFTPVLLVGIVLLLIGFSKVIDQLRHK